MRVVTLARKPPEAAHTLSEGVAEHDTGSLNVDLCRVGTSGGTTRSCQAGFSRSDEVRRGSVHATRGWRTGHTAVEIDAGRWPANVLMLIPAPEGCPEGLWWTTSL